MTVKEAAEILRKHNEWRRYDGPIGEGPQMQDPALIGKAIDTLTVRIEPITIDDLEVIHTFLYAVKNNKTGCFTFTRLSDEQYKEVLRRFNQWKEERK